MLRIGLLFALLAVGLLLLAQAVLNNPGTTYITWGLNSYEMRTATLVFSILVLCILFYIAFNILLLLLGLYRRYYQLRDIRLNQKAHRSLNQGLIQLTEGHWEQAEKLLTEYAQHSETPLFNYLAAARAAHMREAPERRDELLKKAIQSDQKALIAVGVSQAEMQLASNQLEQARATLSRLRTMAPKNTYVLKLFAKVLYRQENWEALVELLPELQKQNLLNTDTMSKVKIATLKGLFNQYAEQKQVDKLQSLWKKLPAPIRAQTEAAQLYAKALQQAGAIEQSAHFIQTVQQKTWQPALADLYGRLNHTNLNQAIQQAEKWLAQQPDNPNSLLLLARLHKQQQLWGVAKSYYEASLNQAPDAEGYLELAELLEIMGEKDNAEQCYRLGLRYSIRRKAERLSLTAAQRPKKKVDATYVVAPSF